MPMCTFLHAKPFHVHESQCTQILDLSSHGVIFKLHAITLVTYSLIKIVRSLFHSLVADGMNHTTQDISTRMVKIVYMKDSINNLSFLSYHFLTYDSERINVLLRKSLLLTVCLLQIQMQKLENMLIKKLQVFHSKNSLNDSGSWNLSVSSFQKKCLILPGNEFQTKC